MKSATRSVSSELAGPENREGGFRDSAISPWLDGPKFTVAACRSLMGGAIGPRSRGTIGACSRSMTFKDDSGVTLLRCDACTAVAETQSGNPQELGILVA